MPKTDYFFAGVYYSFGDSFNPRDVIIGLLTKLEEEIEERERNPLSMELKQEYSTHLDRVEFFLKAEFETDD